MSEAIMETGVTLREVRSAMEEEARIKFAELQDGLRDLFRKRGIPLGPGVSGSALLSILSQAMEMSEQGKYVEHLSADWHDEYQRFVGQIAQLTAHSGIDAETHPDDIVNVIESRLARSAERTI